eukprot:m.128746 g.128746  ORF g.128746 m.128746 type:complete len:57 (+) comp13637_c0_seq1:65-235(+)
MPETKKAKDEVHIHVHLVVKLSLFLTQPSPPSCDPVSRVYREESARLLRSLASPVI